MDFAIEKEERVMYYLIRVIGNFNVSTLTEIRQPIDEALKMGHIYLAFDFERTAFIDSSGIGLLINLLKKQKQNGGGLGFIAINPKVYDILDSSNILRVFDQFKNIEEAVDRIGLQSNLTK